MGQKENLLVVDDDEMNRNMLSRRLERSGFRVGVAAGANEALRMVGEQSFDLILLDQMMPERSGSEMLAELRKQHSASDLPVIMVTAVTESGKVAEALDAGANDYVTKPIDFTVTLARIRGQLARKNAEAARRQSEERYALAARAANDGLWDWNLVNGQIYYSERWKDMLGLGDEEVSSSPEEWLSRVHFQDVGALHKALADHLEGRSEAFTCDYRIRSRDGHFRWMSARGIAVRDATGKAVRMAGSQGDVTEKKTVDPLTQLPNRLLFAERVDEALRRMQGGRRGDEPWGFTVFYLDLDRFKLVNDSLGHAVGDQLLVEFSRRLRQVSSGSDDLGCNGNVLLARLGGDEFAILAGEMTDPALAIKLADRIIRAMRQPVQLDRQEFFSSASIGVAVSRPDHRSVDEVLLDADTAMYVAKARGRGRTAVFDRQMRDRAMSRMRLENDLRVALGRGQFTVAYQPRVDLDDGRICGFEALLRWRHPERGLVEPEEFIPVAEETGLIREIGLWVLGEACRQIKIWRERWPERTGLDVAVNISPLQLRDPELVAQVKEILLETGLDASALQIEITESTVFEDIGEARRVLETLKELGVGLKLDDFATGYSCLRSLCQLPFDTIKIDRSFTADLGNGTAESRELVRTIMTMAQNLNLGVIVEGIENKEGAAVLREMGCRFAQGYYFSHPVNPGAIEDLLDAEKKTP